MAYESVAITAGSGTNIAVDTVAGQQLQVVKLDVGADGASALLSNLNPLPVGDGGGSITVDGTVGVSGTVTVASHAVTNAGTFAVQNTAATPAGTNNIGDVDVLTLPALVAGTANIGDVDVLTLPALPAGSNNIGDVDVLTLPNVTLAAGTNTNEVVGDAAHGASVAGNPLLQGAEARSTDGTAVTSGQATRLQASLVGKQVALPYALPGQSWNYAAAAGGLVTTSGVTAKASAGASTRNYITSAQIINSHQTISTEVEIRDGAAGTVLARLWAQAAGGGVSIKFDPPLRGSAATLVEIAEVTTTATAGVLVNLQGFTAAE